MAPTETISAATFSSPATMPSVATYRYFATTTLVRDAATVISVSHVERSRSPAVVSMLGTKQPSATMMTRKMLSICPSRS